MALPQRVSRIPSSWNIMLRKGSNGGENGKQQSLSFLHSAAQHRSHQDPFLRASLLQVSSSQCVKELVLGVIYVSFTLNSCVLPFSSANLI